MAAEDQKSESLSGNRNGNRSGNRSVATRRIWLPLALGSVVLLLFSGPAGAQAPTSFDEISTVVTEFAAGSRNDVVNGECRPTSFDVPLTCQDPPGPIPNSGWKIGELCYVVFIDGRFSLVFRQSGLAGDGDGDGNPNAGSINFDIPGVGVDEFYAVDLTNDLTPIPPPPPAIRFRISGATSGEFAPGDFPGLQLAPSAGGLCRISTASAAFPSLGPAGPDCEDPAILGSYSVGTTGTPIEAILPPDPLGKFVTTDVVFAIDDLGSLPTAEVFNLDQFVITASSGSGAPTETCEEDFEQFISERCPGLNLNPDDGLPADSVVFELDRNALNGAGEGDDWENVNSPAGIHSAIARTGVITEESGDTIYWRGGSKDIRNVPEWHYKDGSVPPKDDITNAYAAAYNVAGDLLIYFGADRFANAGDAQLGFWFFQNRVSLEENTANFIGAHSLGDLLVLANFSGGGDEASIQVLQWVGTGGDQKKGTLQLLTTGINGDSECDGTGLGGVGPNGVCALTNLGPTPSPWPYQAKKGPADSFPVASFFEGGINISEIFRKQGLPVPCFASFLVETRSSTSVTAQLKDFVIDSFEGVPGP